MTTNRSILTSPDDARTAKQRRRRKRSLIKRVIRWVAQIWQQLQNMHERALLR